MLLKSAWGYSTEAWGSSTAKAFYSAFARENNPNNCSFVRVLEFRYLEKVILFDI